MSFKFTIIILFLHTTISFSQNECQKSEDSLYILINKETNYKDRIKHYIALCQTYKKSNSIKLNNCNEKLLEILKKTNVSKDFGHYYSNKAHVLKKIDYHQSIIYAEKANKIFYNYKDWDNYILNSVEYALILSKNNVTDKSEQLLHNTLSLALRKKNKHVAFVYYGLCDLYNGISDYIKALQFAKKALLLEKDSVNKAKIYYIISRIYTSTKNYKRAIEFNNLAVKNAKENYAYKLNKAHILYNMKRYDEALAIALYYEKNSNQVIFLDNLFIISNCYFELKNYDLANQYIDKRLKIGFKTRTSEIECKTEKAKICYILNDIKSAQKYINESLSLLKEDDYFELKIKIYEIKVKVEEKLGNYKTALLFNKKINFINQTNFTNFNTNKLHQLEVDLDVTEKNNRIKNLQIAQLKKQVEINSKNNYLIFISISFIVVLLLALFYIRNSKAIKKKNLIIESEKFLVKKALTEKETLLKEIHHRVKNNMQLVMSLLSIQAQDETQNINDFMSVSRSRILSMALIHENLYQSESLSNVNFKSYTENLIQIIKNALNTNYSNINIQIDIKDAYLDVQLAIPLGLIINELVSNAYKYAFPYHRNGVIQIKLIQKNINSELTISDNGIGIENIATQKKTLGLQLVEELVFQIDGQMKIINNNGLEYRIRFENTNNKVNNYE